MKYGRVRKIRQNALSWLEARTCIEAFVRLKSRQQACPVLDPHRVLYHVDVMRAWKTAYTRSAENARYISIWFCFQSMLCDVRLIDCLRVTMLAALRVKRERYKDPTTYTSCAYEWMRLIATSFNVLTLFILRATMDMKRVRSNRECIRAREG